MRCLFHEGDSAIAVLHMALCVVVEVLHLVFKFILRFVDIADGFLYVLLDGGYGTVDLVDEWCNLSLYLKLFFTYCRRFDTERLI